MKERFTKQPNPTGEAIHEIPHQSLAKPQPHDVIDLQQERQKRHFPQSTSAPIESTRIAPLPDEAIQSQVLEKTIFNDKSNERRKFFKNLKRDEDDQLTLLQKNARHPVLTKNQMKQVYQAIEDNLGVDALDTEEFLKDTKKEKDQENLKNILYTQETPQDVIIATNQKLIMKVALQFVGRGFSYEDLCSMGNIGLITAIKKFDPHLGFAFSTYATPWIKQAITREIAETGRVINIPVHTYDSLGRAMKLRKKLTEQAGKIPSPNDFKAQLFEQGYEPSAIEFILPELYGRKFTPKSLDKKLSDDDDEGKSVGDLIADKRFNTETDAVSNHGIEELREHLEQAFEEHLSQREVEVLKLRYGIDGQSGATLEQIGHHFGITRERVRQIEAIALRKLRRDDFLQAQKNPNIDTNIKKKTNSKIARNNR